MINTRMRSDSWVLDLDPSEKLLWIYLLTNDHTDLCGIYEIHPRTISMETGFDKDMIEKMLNKFVLQNKIKLCQHWINIINFTKHQSRSPSIKIGIDRSLWEIPSHIIEYFNKNGTECIHPDVLNLDLTKPNLDLTKDIYTDENFTFESDVELDLSGGSGVVALRRWAWLPSKHDIEVKKEKSSAKKEKGPPWFVWPLKVFKCSEKQLDDLYRNYWKVLIDDYIGRVEDYCLAKWKYYQDYPAGLRTFLRRDKIKPKKL